MRIPADRVHRGSQKWIQYLINANEHLLTQLIQQRRGELAGKKILWLSPLENDNFAEYRDSSFLTRLGLQQHAEILRQFWPSRGPQWDGLGRTEDGSAYFLVEAKANIPEVISDCSAKSPLSWKKIRASLQQTQKWLNAVPHVDWTTGFYQYANRLAHLCFLREIARVNAFMIFLYIVHDTTHLPTELDQWTGALRLQKRLMGLEEDRLKDHVIDLFLHTDEIKRSIK